jgi:hypothetical protein
MAPRVASCSCGQLSVTVTEEPVRISICHCLACQQRTGSVFSAQARFRSEAVEIKGTSHEFVRVGDSGGSAALQFCPRCGSTVYWRFGDRGEFTAVAVGAFADPGFPPPGVSVYEDRKHAWVHVPADMEHFP